jgi:hypothetical protein
MGVSDDRPSDPSLQSSTHPSSQLGKQYKIRKNTAVPPAHVCSSDRTTPIHSSPIYRQWVKALELVEAKQHGELHAGSSHGIKNGARGHACKMQGVKREKSRGITVWARTDSGDRCPEDAAEQKA